MSLRARRFWFKRPEPEEPEKYSRRPPRKPRTAKKYKDQEARGETPTSQPQPVQRIGPGTPIPRAGPQTITLAEAVAQGLITSEQAHRIRETSFEAAYSQWRKDPQAQQQYHARREAHFTAYWEKEGTYRAFEQKVERSAQAGLFTMASIISLPMSFITAAGEIDEVMGYPSSVLREIQTYHSTMAVEAKEKGDPLTTVLSSAGSRVAGVGAATYDIATFSYRPKLWMGLGSLALSPKVREEMWKGITEDPLQFGLEVGVGGLGAHYAVSKISSGLGRVSSWAEPQIRDLGVKVITKTPGLRDIYYKGKYGRLLSEFSEFTRLGRDPYLRTWETELPFRSGMDWLFTGKPQARMSPPEPSMGFWSRLKSTGKFLEVPGVDTRIRQPNLSYVSLAQKPLADLPYRTGLKWVLGEPVEIGVSPGMRGTGGVPSFSSLKFFLMKGVDTSIWKSKWVPAWFEPKGIAPLGQPLGPWAPGLGSLSPIEARTQIGMDWALKGRWTPPKEFTRVGGANIPFSGLVEFLRAGKWSWEIPEFYLIDFTRGQVRLGPSKSVAGTPFYKHFTTSVGYPLKAEQLKSVELIKRFTGTPLLGLPAPQLVFKTKEVKTKRKTKTSGVGWGYSYSPQIVTVDPRIREAFPSGFKPAPVTRESLWASLESPYFKQRGDIRMRTPLKVDARMRSFLIAPPKLGLRFKTPTVKIVNPLDVSVSVGPRYKPSLTFKTSPISSLDIIPPQPTRQRQVPGMGLVGRQRLPPSPLRVRYVPRRKKKKKRGDEWGLKDIFELRVDPLKMKGITGGSSKARIKNPLKAKMKLR